MKASFKPDRLAAEWWLTAILGIAAVLALVYSHATDRLDDLIHDSIAGFVQKGPHPDILLVAIDERSLREIGAMPWPRRVHAELIDRLAAGRPRAIAYDVLFLEPGPDDAILGASIKDAGSVFVPLAFEMPGSNGARLDPLLPVAPVREAAAGIGHVNLLTDPAGVVRRVRLGENDGRKHWPHLMEMVRHATPGAAPPAVLSSDAVVRLPFSGPAGTFPSVSAAAILHGELPGELLRDRLVIVGATAQGLGDNHPVPVNAGGEVMPGIELQANLLDGLLRGGIVTDAGPLLRSLAAIIPLMTMLAGLWLLRPRVTMILLIVLMAATIAASFIAMRYLDLWIAPMPTLAGLLLLYPLWAWRKLTGVSAYMVRELELLRTEPGLLPHTGHTAPSSDPVSREAELLSGAITELRAMRRFVGESLDQLPDAVCVIDEQGVITLSNQCAATLLPPADEGQPPRVQDLLEAMTLVAGGPATGLWPPAAADAHGEVFAADGRIFDVQFTERREEGGHRVGWIVRLGDISAIRSAQRQRDDMLHFLTHDMRAPQASILALTSTAAGEKIGPAITERIGRYARRTLELADGIVHLARAETLAFEPEPIDLADLLLDATDMLWPQIQAKQLKLDVRHPDESLTVNGEPGLLARALANLVDNAVKYGRPDGTLTCTLTQAADNGIPMAVCAITNEGDGIAPEMQASLFTRFKRDAANATSHGGAGLGLSFVRTVADRHKGRIDCTSVPGQSTTFALSLPLALDFPA